MNTLAATERVVKIIKSKEVMEIKVDCKYVTGKFDKDVCLLHSKEGCKEKCGGECEDCEHNSNQKE